MASDSLPRPDGRLPDQLRPLRFQNHIAPHAAGSTLIEWGNTRVICAVMVDESVPPWMKAKKVEGGWMSAEYSMLPYSTLDRKARDIVDLDKLGPRTLWVDCDVLQADGGTRTASITGAYVALSLAIAKLRSEGKLTESPLKSPLAAVSLGVVDGRPVLDLNYVEDSAASVDMNLVMNGAGEFIEIQASGEEATFGQDHLTELLRLGRLGIDRLMELQRQAIGASEA
jgi:ribonuclease PH